MAHQWDPSINLLELALYQWNLIMQLSMSKNYDMPRIIGLKNSSEYYLWSPKLWQTKCEHGSCNLIYRGCLMRYNGAYDRSEKQCSHHQLKHFTCITTTRFKVSKQIQINIYWNHPNNLTIARTLISFLHKQQ